MAVLFTQPERNYPPQDNVGTFTVDAAVTRVRISLDHPEWPTGPCVRLRITWPNGDTGVFQSSGGAHLGKDHLPLGGNRILGWECSKPAGVTSGDAHIVVFQALRTAILVEGF